MYNQEQTKALQALTEKLLQKIKVKQAFHAQDIESLRTVLRFHEYRYYVQNDPLLDDAAYDSLFKQLQKMESDDPTLITKDSPTQRVGSSLNASFNTVQHLVPMLSLENSYNAEDLLNWDKSVKKISGDIIEYCAEPKFDGASISLIYEDDQLVRAATRGDGVAGDDITTNIKQIRSIPLSAQFSAYGIQQIEIRGEVLINKVNFKAYNDKLVEQGLAPLANPRNAASGSLRMKDPKDVSKRNLEAFLYHVSYYIRSTDGGKYPVLDTHSSMLQMLWDLGFRSPVKELLVGHTIQEIIDHTSDFEAKRDTLPYEIDGMVVKVNNLQQQDKLGMTTHHPRWAMAFKFKARQATSKLRKVEFQVGRTGSITPVAKIDPVHIGGVTVSSISLFNEEVVKEKDLRIGDTVLVERAGDVIPYIVKSLPELRNGAEAEIVFPKNCPVCGDQLFKTEDEAVWRCINFNCTAQVVERLIHFVSKDAMDIKSFGEANVRKFYELGILTHLPDIYHLDFSIVETLEGFGKKSIEKLQAAIEASKTQPLHRLIFGMGIRYVGETTAKTLANAVEHILDLQHYSEEQLLELEDVGVKVAASVLSFFSNKDNIETLQKLEESGVQLKNDKKQLHVSGNLTGQTFLFTGTLEKLKRTAAEEMVEKNGGKIVGGVSSKLNYLVVGADAGSKLEKAKKIPSIKVITEEDFLKMLAV